MKKIYVFEIRGRVEILARSEKDARRLLELSDFNFDDLVPELIDVKGWGA